MRVCEGGIHTEEPSYKSPVLLQMGGIQVTNYAFCSNMSSHKFGLPKLTQASSPLPMINAIVLIQPLQDLAQSGSNSAELGMDIQSKHTESVPACIVDHQAAWFARDCQALSDCQALIWGHQPEGVFQHGEVEQHMRVLRISAGVEHQNGPAAEPATRQRREQSPRTRSYLAVSSTTAAAESAAGSSSGVRSPRIRVFWSPYSIRLTRTSRSSRSLRLLAITSASSPISPT